MEKMSRKDFLKVAAGFSLPLFVLSCVNPAAAGKKKAAVSLRIAFSEPMDKASVLAAASLITTGGTIKPISADWIDGATVLLGFGSKELDTVTQFKLAGTAVDLAGNALGPYSLQYA